ncbi:1-deoxy-D-xylulose-5-phosphate reductoisomerase [Campylobacter porcelli]|uniref:1-deoxy-D-xylulose 5-phosphate reductoisomerase n=1 Tax=Campylobacter porcelli TaxID=1660073 RepID=A0ABU7M4Q8_9BACT|nr:1-deoxy-D-xylulose-5-phosphate reductoisomerase [Campylobacter sp. CX2-4855-23]
MIVLGSSGSIGLNALRLAREHNLKVEALACKSNLKVLNSQIKEFAPKLVYIDDDSLKPLVNHKFVFSKNDGIESFLKACSDEIGSTKLINAFVGFDGLTPSVLGLKLGFDLALANKESLVVGGQFLDCAKITPIDSEHFGLKFLLKDRPKIHRLIITASGGAFYNRDIAALKDASVEDALKHPNWNMGAKITIDSATMVNKLFEVIEAFWLYGCKNIDAYIETKSLIHALIEFKDGSTTAHISKPDMRLAIAHAIGLGNQRIIENLDIQALQNITFELVDLDRYRAFSLKDELLKNPKIGAIINAANDEIVAGFLSKKVKFNSISDAIFDALDKFSSFRLDSLESVVEINKKVKDYIKIRYNT